MCCRSPPLHTSVSHPSAAHSWYMYMSIVGDTACGCDWGSCSRGPGPSRGNPGAVALSTSASGTAIVRPARAHSSAIHSVVCSPDHPMGMASACCLSSHAAYSTCAMRVHVVCDI
jgi:hypothetical protein